MTSSPPRLARFSPIQMAGMMLMVGAALAGGGLFVFSRSVKAAERIVTVNPALFPHIGKSGQVIAVFEDVNCLHCREFQQLHMGRLIASAKAGQITLVDVQFPFLKKSSTFGAKMLRCTWKHAPNRYYPLREALYSKTAGAEPQTGDYVFALGKSYGKVQACADGAEGAALLKADQDLGAQVGVHSTPFVSLDGIPYRSDYRELVPLRSPGGKMKAHLRKSVSEGARLTIMFEWTPEHDERFFDGLVLGA